MKLFNQLTSQQEADFRLWARQNYQVYTPIDGVWHPVVQDECVRMNAETGYSPDGFNPPGPRSK